MVNRRWFLEKDNQSFSKWWISICKIFYKYKYVKRKELSLSGHKRKKSASKWSGGKNVTCDKNKEEESKN